MSTTTTAARTRDFGKNKAQVLRNLQGNLDDRSKKGSLDAPIVGLVGLLNAHRDYVTTSSCSGRIALFQDVDGAVCRKAGGKWLLSSHAPVPLQAVRDALRGCEARGQEGGAVTLKQEPLVLHIECRDLAAAERLLKLGVASGFRESGVSLGKKRVLVAIRTGANSLETPLLMHGHELMTDFGLEALVELANRKFALNAARTQRLKATLEEAFAHNPEQPGSEQAARKRSLRGKPSSFAGSAKQRGEQGSTWHWVEATVATAGERQLLRRWGHSVCQVGEGTVWLFGGWSEKPAGRRNDLVEITLGVQGGRTLVVQQLCTLPTAGGSVPDAREKHTAVALPASSSPFMVLFGGRASPHKAFGDVWSFERGEGWKELAPSGTSPSARWSHSMTVLPDETVAVYGGRDAGHVYGASVHVLAHVERAAWTWSEVTLGQSSPAAPPPLFAHSASCLGNDRLFLFGGLCDLGGLIFHNEGVLVDLGLASTTTTVRLLPEGGRYGHAATNFGQTLVITGGVTKDAQAHTTVLVLDKEGKLVEKGISPAILNEVREPPLIHHAAIALSGGQDKATTAVLMVGGGVQSFAFSPVFASPLLLLPPSSRSRKQQPKKAAPTKKKSSNGGTPPPPTTKVALPPPAPCPCLLATPVHTKLVKTALERGGLFDRNRRIAISSTMAGCMAIPVLVRNHGEDAQIVRQLQALCLPSPASAAPQPPAQRPLQLFLDSFRGQALGEAIQGWSEETVPYSATALNSHLLRLQAALENALEQSGLSPALLTPAVLAALHVERLGDVLLLQDGHPFRDAAVWGRAFPALWPALLSVYPGASRVARMAPVQNGPKRRSQVQLLYPTPPPEESAQASQGPGSPGWVTVRENRLTYSFDLTRTMFSSGNVSEKARVAQMDCSGQTVVDLYAGIGYYTLPLAVHGKARRVVACEWNVDAVQALRHNIRANDVEDVVEVLDGDNRLTTQGLPDMMADRVHLGLLPSSEEGWPIAARLLRAEGGTVHVHGNMLDQAVEAWVTRIEQEIAALGQALGRPWARQVKVTHCEYVKSFAPCVWHLVADVQCGTGGSKGQEIKLKSNK